MLSSRSLGGKVALVTGGGSGIGAACVRALAEEGVSVLVVDYDAEAAAAIAAEVGGSAFAADVTDPDACIAMVAAALDALGRLDVAVNNAGVGPAGLIPTADISVDDWRGIRVNAVGPGTTETSLTRDAIASEPEKIVARVPLGRVAVPEDIAPLVVFLASDASAFCTGGWYAVDGGWTAQ